MRVYTVGEIAKIVGGELVAGDGSIEITEFSTSSKEGDAATMFVPVIGERVDGHDFIGDASAHGMRATFTCKKDVACGVADMAYVYVDLPGEKNPNVAALQRFGAHVRKMFDIPVIGVTGSVGKTTTKEMVAAALGTRLCTLKTEGNMNSQVGVPRMMCRLCEKHEAAVIEMGMSLPGEMAKIARVAQPDGALITNIGVSHIGQLGSKENIRKEKLNIINELPDQGVLFLNADDGMLWDVVVAWTQACRDAADEKLDITFKENGDGTVSRYGIAMDKATAARFGHIRVVTYGTKPGCDYWAEDIRTVDEKVQFVFRRGNGWELDENGKMTERALSGQQKEDGFLVRLPVAGEHNVLNALAAFAVAEHCGIAPGQAAEGLSAYEPIPMRGGKIQVNGMVLIDDTYNASPDSMKGSISNLMAVKAKRHIAVLGDMLELGGISRQCHELVGCHAAKMKVDYLVAVGKEARYYAAAVQEWNGPEGEGEMETAASRTRARTFDDNASALVYLKELAQAGDALLFKGSRGMKMEELVAGLAEVERQ